MAYIKQITLPGVTDPYDIKAATLDGLTATVSELNYTDGVTSNIQTQLNAKEVSSNKKTSISSSSTDTEYPSAKAVYSYVESQIGAAMEGSY